MKLFNRIMNDEQGVLTFEWILLLAILVIGVVGGLAAVRDALNIQLGSSTAVILGLNQSVTVAYAPKIQLTIPSTFAPYYAGISAGGAVNHSYARTTIDLVSGTITDAIVKVDVAGGTAPDPVLYP